MMKMRFYLPWTASPRSYIFLSTTHEIKYPIITERFYQHLKPRIANPNVSRVYSGMFSEWSIEQAECLHVKLTEMSFTYQRQAVFRFCFWICSFHHLYFITIFDRNVDSEKCFSTPRKVSAQYWWWMTPNVVAVKKYREGWASYCDFSRETGYLTFCVISL